MIVLALIGQVLLAQKTVNDLHRFAEAVNAATRGEKGNTKPLVLDLVEPRTKAQLDPPARNAVRRSRQLGKHGGVPCGHVAYGCSKADALGPSGQGRQGCP